MSDPAIEGRAGRGWDRWRLGWLALAMLFLAPVGYAGPLGLVPLVGIPALALIPAVRFRSWPWLFLALAALLAWALIAWTWSPVWPDWSTLDRYPEFERQTGLKLAFQLLLYAVFVVAADRLRPVSGKLLGMALAAAIAVLTLVLLYEGATGGGLYRAIDPEMRPDLAFKNAGKGAFVAAVLFWPAAGVVLRRFDHRGVAIAWILGVLLVTASLLLGLAAAGLAVTAGGAAYLVFRLAPRAAGWAAGLAVAGFALAVPWLAQALPASAGLPPSWAARIDIWRFVSERVLQRPGLGWGLDASRTFGGPVPLHPHDAPLQMWAELGAPGAVLFAVVWGVIFWACARVGRRDPGTAGVWAGTATAFFVIGALSFGAWQDWWLALGALAIAACLFARRGWPTDAAPSAGPGDLQPLRPLQQA